MKHQRDFFNKLADKLNIKKRDDWYKVSARDIIKNGGKRLVIIYGGSVHRALSSIFPEHKWIPWKFENAPKNFWKQSKNVKEFLESIKKELNIEKDEDWYQVTQNRLHNVGATTILNKFGGICKLLSAIYPEKDWETILTNKNDKRQKNLCKVVNMLLPVLQNENK